MWVQQPKIIIIKLEVRVKREDKLTFGAGVAATVSFLGSAAGVAGVAPGVADGSISTKDAPTATVSPSFAWYFVITPLYFARISTVTLSVSIRAMISSALTDAPTSKNKKFQSKLCHLLLTKDSTTPSLMESPIVGTC